MKNFIYLASKSSSRKKLLEKAGIAFEIIEQDADESQCDWGLPLKKVVESIAQHKMNHVIMPKGTEGQIAYVLTADTLSFDPTGTIRGKPTDMNDAIAMLKAARGGVNRCGTALCLEKKIFTDGAWHTQKRITRYAEAHYEFEVPDECIDEYIKRANALEAAGAIKIEYGPQFLKHVHGSYAAIVGLPMYELREALQEIGCSLF